MPLTPIDRLTLFALRRLPVHALSRAAGRAVGYRLPAPLQRAEIRLFGALAGVDFSEAADPIEAYGSLQEFFTRALAEGARPVDPDPEALVAPCDGAWGAACAVEDGTLLQIKGRPYSLGALLAADAEAGRFEGGSFATFYLSPRDYHRLHAPCALRVRRAVYVPGTLWPVNRAGVEGVDGLFAQNERLCVHADTEGGGSVVLVAVGATMVGKVRLTFDELTTNVTSSEPVARTYAEPGHVFEKGEEWGRFEFGSTLVMIATPGTLTLDESPPGTPLRLGTRIGTLRP